MKLRNNFILLVLAVLLTGCSSGFQYYPGSEDYRNKPLVFSRVIVSVDLKSEKSPAGYMTAEEIQSFMENHIVNLMKDDKEVSYDADAKDGLTADIYVHYTRKFSYGDALAKPVFNGKNTIRNGDLELGSYSYGDVTTGYGSFRGAVVNFKIAFGQWDFEDEPRDFEIVAKAAFDDLKSF